MEKERLEEEMRIAERIQTSLLPEVPTNEELEITAVMKTATEVGGDYYDFLLGKDNGSLWEDERFHQSIIRNINQYQNLDEMRDHILKEALDWCGNENEDDMTMVAVRMK